MWRQNQRQYREKQQAHVVVGEAPESSDEDDDYSETEPNLLNSAPEEYVDICESDVLNAEKVCILFNVCLIVLTL